MAELYRKRLCRRFQCHPWNKDNLACIITTKYVTPKNHCSNLQQHYACAITKTIAWTKVVKQHERTSWLESNTCQRKSRSIQGVEELNRVYVRVVTIDLVYYTTYGLAFGICGVLVGWWNRGDGLTIFQTNITNVLCRRPYNNHTVHLKISL